MLDHLIKDQLLDRIKREHAQFEAAYASLSDARMIQPGVEGEWSVKDILAHLAFWQRRKIDMFQCALRAEQPPRLRADGESWEDALARINAEQFAIDRDHQLAEVRAGFMQSYQQMLALIESLSEEDLSESSRLAPSLGSGVLAAVAEDTYEHCQEHVDSIRAWVKRETSNS
jgi:hypothetical protein